MGEGSWENLWSIKAMLLGFKMASCLCVIFFKSKIIGVHLKEMFLEIASYFLSYGISYIPFMFLGIPIGDNHRRRETWTPILSKTRSRLSGLKWEIIFIGGRVVLLNLVLTTIPIYLFSFYKAPKAISFNIKNVQRDFLWWRHEEKRRINWVCWAKV